MSNAKSGVLLPSGPWRDGVFVGGGVNVLPLNDSIGR